MVRGVLGQREVEQQLAAFPPPTPRCPTASCLQLSPSPHPPVSQAPGIWLCSVGAPTMSFQPIHWPFPPTPPASSITHPVPYTPFPSGPRPFSPPFPPPTSLPASLSARLQLGDNLPHLASRLLPRLIAQLVPGAQPSFFPTPTPSPAPKLPHPFPASPTHSQGTSCPLQ